VNYDENKKLVQSYIQPYPKDSQCKSYPMMRFFGCFPNFCLQKASKRSYNLLRVFEGSGGIEGKPGDL